MKVSRPDRDPLTARERLDAALIAAAAGGDITPAIDIATELIQPALVTRLRGQVLAKALVDLSIRHAAEAAPAPDPYAKLAQHLVDIHVCGQYDLHAALGRALNVGIDQGWLESSLYDRIATAAGDEPLAQGLLKRIERRVNTPHDKEQAG